jgi:hypothetical protein
MAGLPKFVRGRLAQGPGADEHPGADLLNAFCEDALRPAEREHLLAHLAACAECREVVALLTPEEGPPRLGAKPQRHWFSFPILRFPALRWAALTAAVTVVIGAALLYRPEPVQRARSDAEAPPSATVQPLAKVQTAESSAGSAPPASPAPESKKQMARKQESRQPALDSGAPSETMSAASSAASQTPAEQETAKLGKTYAVNPRSVHGPHASLQQQANQSAQQAPSKTPVMAFRPKMAAPAGATADAARQAQARQEMAQSAMSARASQSETSQAPKADSKPAAPAYAPVPFAGTGAAGASASSASSASSSAAGGVSAPYSAEPVKPIAASWSISSDGQLLRKLGGEEPHPIRVADNVRFRAVASIRAEVWAGGPGGLLYHSSDSGASWNKVAFPSTQDITAIAFRNVREGTITVAGGERYATRDAGQSWLESKDF